VPGRTGPDTGRACQSTPEQSVCGGIIRRGGCNGAVNDVHSADLCIYHVPTRVSISSQTGSSMNCGSPTSNWSWKNNPLGSNAAREGRAVGIRMGAVLRLQAVTIDNEIINKERTRLRRQSLFPEHYSWSRRQLDEKE
jgi:hypothetical protein